MISKLRNAEMPRAMLTLGVLLLLFVFSSTVNIGPWFIVYPPFTVLFILARATRDTKLVTSVAVFMGWVFIGFVVPTAAVIGLSEYAAIIRAAAWGSLLTIPAIAIHKLRSEFKLLSILRETEHKSSLLEIERKEMRSRGLIEYAQDAFIGIDKNGLVTDWNKQAEQTFGWSKEEALGKELSLLITPCGNLSADPPSIEHYLSDGFGSAVNRRIEISANRRDGKMIPIELIIYPVTVGGEIEYGSFLHDISDRKKIEIAQKEMKSELERKVEERTRELETALEKANTASRLKDEFLSTLSHELRTPMGVILGYSDLLIDECTSETERAYASTIQRNANAQVKLIDDLLDSSRIITGKLTLDRKQINLVELVADVMNSQRLNSDAKQIQLNFTDRTTGSMRSVEGDDVRLRQVVWNLLANALKFTDRGGQIDIETLNVDSKIVVKITDSGKGIDPAFLPFVFEKFRQEDSSITRSYGGLGLGLSIVKSIVESHGGVCRVESQGLGHGTTFSFEIPRYAIAKNPTLSLCSTTPDKNDILKDLRVLIVDDEPDYVNLLRTTLNKTGAIVREASSGPEALKILDTFDSQLVFSDLEMPGFDGYSLAREIRNRRPDNPPICIALSAHASSADLEKSKAAGFERHLSKPIAMNRLLNEMVAVALNQKFETPRPIPS